MSFWSLVWLFSKPLGDFWKAIGGGFLRENMWPSGSATELAALLFAKNHTIYSRVKTLDKNLLRKFQGTLGFLNLRPFWGFLTVPF